MLYKTPKSLVMMYLRFSILCALCYISICKPLKETSGTESALVDSEAASKTQIGEEMTPYSESGKLARDQSSPNNNPLSGLQNFFGGGNLGGSGQSSSPAGSMPPIMVLGMHQAILVPLTALPNIFQSMMTGLFNSGNSQQGGSLMPGLTNVMG